MKEYQEELERLREKMHKIVSQKGINSPEGIRASQALDRKINEYYSLRR